MCDLSIWLDSLDVSRINKIELKHFKNTTRITEAILVQYMVVITQSNAIIPRCWNTNNYVTEHADEAHITT